jgi:hypothetical protein
VRRNDSFRKRLGTLSDECRDAQLHRDAKEADKRRMSLERTARCKKTAFKTASSKRSRSIVARTYDPRISSGRSYLLRHEGLWKRSCLLRLFKLPPRHPPLCTHEVFEVPFVYTSTRSWTRHLRWALSLQPLVEITNRTSHSIVRTRTFEHTRTGRSLALPRGEVHT